MEDLIELGLEGIDKLAEDQFYRIPDRVFEPRRSHRSGNATANDEAGKSSNYLEQRSPVPSGNQQLYQPPLPRPRPRPRPRSEVQSARFPPRSSAPSTSPRYSNTPYSAPLQMPVHPYINHGHLPPTPRYPPRPNPYRRASSLSPVRRKSSNRSIVKSPTSSDSKYSHSLRGAAAGAIAGGIVGQEMSESKPVVSALAGVFIGALGAGLMERRRGKQREIDNRDAVDSHAYGKRAKSEERKNPWDGQAQRRDSGSEDSLSDRQEQRRRRRRSGGLNRRQI